MSNPPHRRVFLVGYYGVPNVGDEAIRAAIEHGAADAGATVTWYSTRDPADRSERAVRLRDGRFVRYAIACSRADRVVLGGGGILKDEGWGMPVELFITSLLARLSRTPIRMLAVGVGPFYTRLGRMLVAAVARMCEVRSVRDPDSAGELARLGIRGVEVAADPIFSLLPVVRSAARVPDAEPTALISVRPWFHMGESDGESRRDRLRSAIRDAAQLLVERGYAVEFIGMHWPRDRQEAEAIVSGLPANDRIRVRDARVTWSSLVEACASASLVIGMRYHALAAAAMVGRPAVAVAYEPKVESLANSLGLFRVSVDSPDIVERLPLLVRDALDRPHATQAPESNLAALHAASVGAIRRALG